MITMTTLNAVTRPLARPISFTKAQAFSHIVWRENAMFNSEFISDMAALRFDPCPRSGKTPRR